MSKPRHHLAGPWIGETQGCDSPAHLWSIEQHGEQLSIETTWEGQKGNCPMYGALHENEDTFTVVGSGTHIAHILDPQHFVIEQWDTNDIRDGVGPNYDVVFSRPGIAELTANEAWLRFVEKQKSQPKTKPKKVAATKRKS
jgi:hypothetical protein